MEEMVSEPKNYEMAFHLNPDLEEEELRKEAKDIEEAIKRAGGSTLFYKEPARIPLSYPIKNYRAANFGFINFSAQPENIEKLEAEIRLKSPVLRYVIVKKEHETRTLHKPQIQTHKAPKVKEEPSAKPEEIEKELEEVLGKL